MTAIASTAESFILAKRANGRASRTVDDYYRCLTPFIEWCGRRGLDTQTLDRNDFRRYIVEELRSNDWAQNTVGIHISNLRCFLSWSHDEGYIDDDLAQAVEAPEKTIRVENPLTPEELQAIIEACDGDRWVDRDRAAILTLMDTGLRRGEMVQLKRDYFTTEDGVAWFQMVDPKSKEVKILILGESTSDALRQYLDNRKDNDSALWMGRWGPLTHEGIYSLVKKRSRMAGVERAHPHLFRKTFATWWIRRGGDETRLKTLAGWSDSSEVLRVYVLLGKLPDLLKAHGQFGPVDGML